MEIETELNNDNYFNINHNLFSKQNNSIYSNENTPYNSFNNLGKNQYFHNLFFNKKKVAKRTYNESLNSTDKIKIKEKEAKYLYKIFNQLKLKIDSENNYIKNTESEIKIRKKGKNGKKEEEKDILKHPFVVDYSAIDFKDIVLQLYKSNNISDELKSFISKKLINNAIEVEKTFKNYFNINLFPNKK